MFFVFTFLICFNAFLQQYFYVMLSGTATYCVMLSDMVTYCVMLSDMVTYCAMLSDMVTYCAMLSDMAPCCEGQIEGVAQLKDVLCGFLSYA